MIGAEDFGDADKQEIVDGSDLDGPVIPPVADDVKDDFKLPAIV